MPNQILSVGTTEMPIAGPDPTREAFTIINTHASQWMYYSDEPGQAAAGVPIPPNNGTVTLTFKAGWKPGKPIFLVASGASTTGVLFWQ